MAWGTRRPETTDDYIGVLVPLEEAHRYGHSRKQGKTEYEEAPTIEDPEIDARLDSLARDSDDDDEDDLEAGKEESDNEAAGMLQMTAAEYTIEGLRAEMSKGQGGGPGGGWTSYEIKSKLINKAVQDIGMGSYNWQLFLVCGFGWFADNLWLQGASLTLPSLSGRFEIDEKRVRLTTSALFTGLSVGSFAWGIGADYTGRRLPFNMCLLIASVFGTATGFMQSWYWVNVMYAILGSGVGGSLPVDGALFLEFLPESHSWLLTLLSVWWPLGQLVSSLIAWFFIGQWSLDAGWRYFLATIGLLTFTMFFIRFFIFRLFESPKFLLNQGRQDEAVAVIHGLAYKNGTKTWLTSDILNEVAGTDETEMTTLNEPKPKSGGLGDKFAKFSPDKVQALFKDKKLGVATALMWTAWATIGMGYPLFAAFLPQYFAKYSTAEVESETASISNETYRNYAYTSMFGVPGSCLAAWLVNNKFFGRKGTLAMSTLLSAFFQLAFVMWGSSSNMQLLFSCLGAFAQNIMYGVLYAYTPEIFPAPVRGAGTGVASFLNRIAGLGAPILASSLPGDAAEGPIYISAVLVFFAFLSICFIPIETRGAQTL